MNKKNKILKKKKKDQIFSQVKEGEMEKNHSGKGNGTLRSCEARSSTLWSRNRQKAYMWLEPSQPKGFKTRLASDDTMPCSHVTELELHHENEEKSGIPGWLSGLAPAFGPGCNPGVPGSSPTSGSWHGACFSLRLCLWLSLSHE